MKNAGIFHLLGVLVLLVWRAQKYCCASVKAEPGPCPKAASLFLTAPPLCLHPVPFQISNCYNLPLGTQGRSWKWKWNWSHSVCLFATSMDCSLAGSSVHGIFQARILEWVAISFSRRSSQLRDWTQVSCIVGRCFTIWDTKEDSKVMKTGVYSLQTRYAGQKGFCVHEPHRVLLGFRTMG